MNGQQNSNLVEDVVVGLTGAEQSPVWGALQKAFKIWAEQETQRALAPNLTSDQRHYCAGGAAVITDFGEWLQLHCNAAKQRGPKKRG